MKNQWKRGLSALLMIAMIVSMLVVPAAAATAADVGTFTFDVTQKGTLAQDKVAGTEETFGYFGAGTETAVAYFKTIGTTTWRTSNGNGTVPKRVEVGKAAAGKIEFTVTGAADVTLKLISTGSSDVNVATLLGDGSPVAATDATPAAKGGMSADKKYVWVAESGRLTVTYENLPAGTYTLQAPAVTPANFGGTGDDWTTAFEGKSLNGVSTFADANAKKKVNPNERGIGVESIVVDQRAGGAPVEKNTYTVTADTATHGTVSVSPTSAQKGDTITVTATPEDNTYLVKSITATGASGAKADITLTATGGTFKMLDENVTVAAEFELKPVAADNEWLSSHDTIPGGPTVGENPGTALTAETQVTPAVDGVKLYVGAGTYKYKESMMMGNANTDVTIEQAAAGTLPGSGTYFKFVAEKDGILKIIGKVGEVDKDTKKLFVNTNGTAEAPAAWNVSDKLVDQELIFNMKKDDVIVIFGVTTKPAVKSYTYTVMEAKTGKWEASLADTPNATEADKPGTALTEETLVDAKVDGVKLYFGPTAYKFSSTESIIFGSDNANNVNAETGYAKPTSGTYFKFVIEKDGVLKPTMKWNNCDKASKKFWIAKNDEPMDDYNGFQVTPAEVRTETLSVKAGDVIIIVGAGTKPGLKGFEFTTGGVTEATAPWTAAGIFANPTMTATDDGKGTITVDITGVKVGKVLDGASMTTYADNVTVTMLDKNGAVAATGKSAKVGATHSIKFNPAASGDYTFKAVAQRAGETDLDTKLSASVTGFVLPLAVPTIRVAQNEGNATVKVFWTNVDETDGYNVYVNGTKVNTELVKTNSYTITSGLTVGTEVSITVTAVRGTEETKPSEAVKITPSAEKKVAWGKQIWGISVDPAKKNSFKGDLNEGDSVTLAAINGGGKINDDSRFDGLQFYYTIIPADQNFTLRGKVHVDEWTYSNGQEGFGMLAQDSLPDHVEYGEGKEAGHATNQYFMGGLRMSYWYSKEWETLGDDSGDGFDKFNCRLGIGTRAKVGLTPENVDLVYAQDNATLQMWAPADTAVPNSSTSFSTAAGVIGQGNSNVIGNCTNQGSPDNKEGLYAANYTTIANLVDFDLEITRNNTGYILRYYDEKGTLVGEDIKYDSYDALTQLDPDNIYVGFWVARNATITVTDVNLELRDPKDDPAPLEAPPKRVFPYINITSVNTSQTEDYDLVLESNVAGTAVITQNNVQLDPVAVTANAPTPVPVTLKGEGTGINRFNVIFTPDPDQFTEADHKTLFSDKAIEIKNFEVTYRIKWSEMVNLYVSPNGGAGGQGTKNSPIDIETAVKVARPGQTIVLKEGTYSLRKKLQVNPGMNGTEEQPIRMIADPEATSRPVLDFNKAGGGLTIAADWWYLYGFNVTRSNSNGIQITGNHNVAENIEAYANYSAGIAIARLNDKLQPTLDTWPSYNLVKNCTAWNNADAGHEDADGFTAKLTCGVGNVFDGCVAHHNADDGWDMYVTAATGVIGATTLKNCIAFKNGYLFDDEGNEFVSGGNGNGLKLGGGGFAVENVVENCYAFLNKNKGIDSNSNSAIIVKNSTSYNNGLGSTAPEYESKGWNGYNVALYTEGSGATTFQIDGVLSFKDAGDDNQDADNLKPGGSQTLTDLQSDTNFYWDGTKSVNKSGATFTADMFKSLEFVDGTSNKVGLAGTLTRDANGVLNLGDFLQKSDSAPAGAGADKLENEPSEAPEVAEETGKPIGGSTGGGGGGGRDREDPPVVDTESKTTATKTVDRMGNVEIVVKNEAGEVIADVKVPASIPTPKDKFVDVPAGHWAEDAINAIAGLGLVNGVDAEAHIYDMNSATTRAALAKILYQLANGKEGLANEFKDVAAGQWFENPVAWAASVGVVNGFEDGTFRPNQPITREQLAVMLCRFARLIGMDTTPKAELNGFADQDKVGSWAADSLAWCVENGILKGKGADTLDPQADATRAEVAVMLQRFINLVK